MREIGRRKSLIARAALELSVVGGGALIFVFWIIPSSIASGSNLGLAPAMLPTACAVAIAILAGIQFVLSSLRRFPDGAKSSPGKPLLAVSLAAVTIMAALLIDTSLLLSGAVLVGFVSAVLGERHPLRIGAISASAGGVMLAVQWSGL